MQKEVVTIEEINQTYPFLKIETLRRWCLRGQLPAKKLGKRWLVKIVDIEKLTKGDA